MEAALYAEVYLICMMVVGLLLHWSVRSDSRSASDQWLIRCFGGFFSTFSANFLFILFNRGIIATPWTRELSYAFKSLFFLMFSNSVIAWCGYAETEIRRGDMVRKKVHLMFIIPSIIPILPSLAGDGWKDAPHQCKNNDNGAKPFQKLGFRHIL